MVDSKSKRDRKKLTEMSLVRREKSCFWCCFCWCCVRLLLICDIEWNGKWSNYCDACSPCCMCVSFLGDLFRFVFYRVLCAFNFKWYGKCAPIYTFLSVVFSLWNSKSKQMLQQYGNYSLHIAQRKAQLKFTHISSNGEGMCVLERREAGEEG